MSSENFTISKKALITLIAASIVVIISLDLSLGDKLETPRKEEPKVLLVPEVFL